ncbi:MAG: hypothetical protein IJ190_00920 [Prevotella sp.]|nr:hypothetical protein [Prevotella sp.]
MEQGFSYSRFYALLGRMLCPDRDEMKRSLVLEYTAGRTESLREMRLAEYNRMCDDLARIDRDTSRAIYVRERRRWRSAVLHQLQLIGVDTADWDRVNAYCRDPRIAGKAFRELSPEELEALLPKLRAILRKQTARIVSFKQ